MKAVWPKNLLREKNVAVTFQYTLHPQDDTVLSLAVANLYRLFVNGELVGYGPARAAHGHCRPDTYPLKAWSGIETVLSVEVYSAHVNSYYVLDEDPFFAAEIKNGDQTVATAADFTAYRMTERLQKVRRFSRQRTFTESYRLNQDPKAFYAGRTNGRTPVKTDDVPMDTLLPRHVHYPTLHAVCAAPMEHGTLHINPDTPVVPDRALTEIHPQLFKAFTPAELEENAGREAEELVYEPARAGAAETLPALTYQTYDFGRTVSGFFAMQVHAIQETTLLLLFDEVVADCGTHHTFNIHRNDCCNVIKYTLAPGDYHLIAFEPNTARFASVAITSGAAQITDFGMRLYENPDAGNYRYDYGDDALNKIVRAAVDTFAQNAVDILTDCPSRERAGWTGDCFWSSRSEHLFTGDCVVEKSLLENYALCPQIPSLPDGMIPMCYPADPNRGLYIPSAGLLYIWHLHQYYHHTGDKAMLQLSRRNVEGVLRYFDRYQNDDGLLENLEGWVHVDQSKASDKEFTKGVNHPYNTMWARALDYVAELYHRPELAEKAEKIRKKVRTLSWNGEFFEDNSVRDEQGNLVRTGHTSESWQYMAFSYGLVEIKEYPEFFQKLRTEFGPHRDLETEHPTVYPTNAIIGIYLRLELLLQEGYYDQMLQECRDYFLGMAEATGTLWEHAASRYSLNHGFASVVAVYIDEAFKKMKQ